MSQINPYQPPVQPAMPAPGYGPPPPGMGVWRQGNQLVMHLAATLPDRCVKSNAPANGFKLKRSMNWHPSWVYITVLVSPLVYLIVAMAVRKYATVNVGLSEDWHGKFKVRRLITWVLAGLGVAAMALGCVIPIALADQFGDALGAMIPIGFLVGLALLIAASIFGSLARLVKPAKITDQFVWLKGVNADYLAALPEFPYPHL